MIAPFIHDEDTVARAIDDPVRGRQVICERFLDDHRNAAIDQLFDHFGPCWSARSAIGPPADPPARATPVIRSRGIFLPHRPQPINSICIAQSVAYYYNLPLFSF